MTQPTQVYTAVLATCLTKANAVLLSTDSPLLVDILQSYPSLVFYMAHFPGTDFSSESATAGRKVVWTGEVKFYRRGRETTEEVTVDNRHYYDHRVVTHNVRLHEDEIT